MLIGVWAVVAGAAILIAHALDDPVGAGARDKAQPAALGTVAGQDGAAATLPPFTMVLDHQLPADVAGLAPAQQAEELRTRAMATGDPVTLVELGSVMQVLGDAQSAEFSYRSALERDPQSVAAQVGLALVPGTSGADGLDVAARRLEQVAAAHPDDQLVTFNRAWLELYRGNAEPAAVALRRTVALDPTSRLGRAARALLAAAARARAAQGP
jgi:hypothetical protein